MGPKAIQSPPQLLILDIRMPGRSGLEGLPDFKQENPEGKVIIITAFHDMESTINAMQKGADDYIHKPIDIDELDASISKLSASLGDSRELLAASPSDSGRLTMVGRSRSMKEVFKTIGFHFVDDLQHLAQLPARKPFLFEPHHVGLREVDESSPFIPPKGHTGPGKGDEVGLVGSQVVGR